MSTPRTLDYTQVDVSAERPLEGNMLAIFHDATGLTQAEMQALARETHLSETTFIEPAVHANAAVTEKSEGVRVRIFTTQEELQFAGHPTLGTASWLYWNHPTLKGSEEITLALNVGPVTVRFQPPDDRPGIFGTMRQPEPTFGALHDPQAIAEAVGLEVEDLDPTMPIQTVSTGMPFCIVPLRSVAIANRLAIPQGKAVAYLAQSDAKFFHCIAPVQQGSRAQWHARMQFYNGEDPATGSASGCTIAYLVRHGFAPSGETVILEQGIEMVRPSEIHASATYEGETVTKVFVGGRTIPVAMGRFFLPRF